MQRFLLSAKKYINELNSWASLVHMIPSHRHSNVPHFLCESSYSLHSKSLFLTEHTHSPNLYHTITLFAYHFLYVLATYRTAS